ncbi:MAG TPA: plastocyanin/azurin family copper-binding protein [Gemmatimonadales bacterium]|nr:plastocyanin/azurin family copper-binding protein [Gemmatimonadales bacterium]
MKHRLRTHRPIRSAVGVVVGIVLGLTGCGGNDGGSSGAGPGPSDLVLAKAATSGDNQTATVGTALKDPVRIVATRGGTADPGNDVSWTVVSGGGTVTPDAPTTGADGSASAHWTLGNTAGTQTLRAAIAGATPASVQFSATAQAGPAASITIISGNGQQGTVSQALGSPLVVGATDAHGNAVAGVMVQWAVTGGGGSVSPASGATGSDGHASAQWTLGSAAGPNTLTAAANGASGALTGSPLQFTATGVVPPPAPTHADIQVQNDAFVPQSVTIAAGGTVTWTWVGQGHNVTPVLSPTFAGPSTTASAPFTYGPITFNAPGTYQYICTVHGALINGQPSGMRGTIVVQ